MEGPPPAPHPDPNVSIAGKLIGPTTPLAVISVTLCSVRAYSRTRPVLNLGVDDFTILVAVVCATAQWGTTIGAIPYGYGRHNIYIPLESQKKAGRLLFATQVLWTWAVVLAKISIAFMIYRIKNSLRWKIFLYTMVFIQIASAIAANTMQFSQCRPLAANWDFSIPGARCWPPHVSQTCIITLAAIGIITDIVFTCIPLSFIRSIKRPLREKIVLTFLFGLGVLTSVASIIKTTKVRRYGENRDIMYTGIDLALWSTVEEQVGIIAACIPCLKAPGERLLRRVGLLSSNRESHEQSNWKYRRSGHSSQSESYALSTWGPGRTPESTVAESTRLDLGSEENMLSIESISHRNNLESKSYQ